MRGPYRIKTRDPQNEAHLPQMSNQWRATMQKTALTIFGALLISGMAVQMAAASEHHHHVTKANFSRHHPADFRGAYNQVKPINVTPRALYRTDTDGSGFRGVDPSWIGDRDPSLNPAD
jgi:hypothetical protein